MYFWLALRVGQIDAFRGSRRGQALWRAVHTRSLARMSIHKSAYMDQVSRLILLMSAY